MNFPERRIALPRIKRRTYLPCVHNKTEVRQLLAVPKYLRHRYMQRMLYGCGLRSYELCNLKLADLDFYRKTVFVRKLKGKYHRHVPRSDHLNRGLCKYITSERPHNYRCLKSGSRISHQVFSVGLLHACLWYHNAEYIVVSGSSRFVCYLLA